MQRLGTTLLFAVATLPLAAQEPQCNTLSASATRACNVAVDALKAFHPLAGLVLSGGNPVLGGGATLGGIGHLSLTARVNAVKIAVPDPDSVSQSPVPSRFDGVVPAPLVEGALGLIRGAGGGLLSIDALGSAVLLPTGRVQGLTVDSGAARIGSVALGVGYGARVGLLKGSFPIPGVSLSWMHRTLPRVQFGTLGAAFGAGDQFEFDTDLKADNYRAVAGWRLVLLDLAAGVGIDRYTSTAHIRFHDDPLNPGSVRTVPLNPRNTREVLFVNAGLSLTAAQLVAELGYQTGKDQRLSTRFSGFDPKAGHVFGGVGVRFGF